VARSIFGSTAVASSTVNANFPASGAIDGEHNGNNWGSGGGWNDGTRGAYPDNIQVNFNINQTINEIDVYTLKNDFNSGSVVTDTTTFTSYGITNFNVQYWTGSVWTDVPGGAVTGNNLVKRKFIFPDITTDRIRVVVNASADNLYSRVVEIEAFACAPVHVLCVNPGGTGGCFSTIQAAVNAASPGDVINVAAGTYPEGVNVNKRVSLFGAQAGGDPRAGACNNAPATESVVSGNAGTTPFHLTVSDVVIDGFTVTGQTNVNQFGAGIVIAPGTSGARVVNNKIHDNVVGLFLANSSASDQGIVRRNLFCNNTQSGSASGHGIYSDQFVAGGPIRNVLIDSNNFVNNNGYAGGTWGIGMSNSDTANPNTNLQIVNNSLDSSSPASRGMYLYSTDSSSITGNSITNKTNYAIGVFGADDGISIECNLVQNNVGGRGVYVSDDLTTPNTIITANYNNVSGNTTAGLAVDAGTYTGILNAENNWWGNATGPTIGSNPGGTGDAIVDPDGVVDYSPFATAVTTCPTLVVSPGNSNGWASVSQRTASGSFVNGPPVPPAGVGSFLASTGAGNSGPDLPQGGAGTGGKNWETTQQYDNTLLSNIGALRYSTYVSSSPLSSTITSSLQFQVDLDGNGSRDCAMVFEPVYSTISNGGTQPNIAVGVWQNWDAKNGRWWFTATTPGGTFCGQNCFVPFNNIVAAYPSAKIVTWFPLTDGFGTQLVTGQNSAGAPWSNFVGNFDRVRVGLTNTLTTFDFEPVP
jgi:nitrous oxidase accessory protein NosD